MKKAVIISAAVVMLTLSVSCGNEPVSDNISSAAVSSAIEEVSSAVSVPVSSEQVKSEAEVRSDTSPRITFREHLEG